MDGHTLKLVPCITSTSLRLGDALLW